MEHFVIIVNNFQPLTIITKRSILDVAVVLDPLLIISKIVESYIMKVIFAMFVSILEVFEKMRCWFKDLLIFTKIERYILFGHDECVYSSYFSHNSQKMKFSIKNFFNKCDQIRRKLRIWSHLVKKSLNKQFIFCTVTDFGLFNGKSLRDTLYFLFCNLQSSILVRLIWF